MVATNAALASGGITHCCLRCGLRMFFLASARSCCRWRARQCAVRQPSPRADAGSIWQSLPGPERASARSVLLPPRRRKSAAGRSSSCICGPTPPRTFLDQLAPGPLDSGDAGVQRRGDPALAPAFARIPYVRLQQAARPRQQLGGTLAFANQLVESIAFLRVEPDHVFLDGNLFPGHESPPSLPCRDRDSEIPVIINDGGDTLVDRSASNWTRLNQEQEAVLL